MMCDSGKGVVVIDPPSLGRSGRCREDAIGGCLSRQHLRRGGRGDRPIQVSLIFLVLCILIIILVRFFSLIPNIFHIFLYVCV